MIVSTMLKAQPLTNYSTFYGFDPENKVDQGRMLSMEKARTRHQKGESFALLFGDPKNPEYYITLHHSIEAHIDPGLTVVFVEAGVETRAFFLRQFKRPPDPQNNTFIHEYLSDFRDGQGRRGVFHIHRALGTGDLPELEFNREVWHSVSVPWQDFFVGPFPSFDDLIDGSFVERLPKITMPPEQLLVDHIHQRDRTAKTPKRDPIGRFPW